MYVIKHRATGWYLAKLPYKNSDSRYTREKSEAQTFSRYAEAFNSCRAGDMVLDA